MACFACCSSTVGQTESWCVLHTKGMSQEIGHLLFFKSPLNYTCPRVTAVPECLPGRRPWVCLHSSHNGTVGGKVCSSQVLLQVWNRRKSDGARSREYGRWSISQSISNSVVRLFLYFRRKVVNQWFVQSQINMRLRGAQSDTFLHLSKV